MMSKALKELILLVMVFIPYAYLYFIWDLLPEQVPTHFNIEGKADDWSDKSSLLFITGAIGLSVYLLMLIVPALDPKKKIHLMGNKYYHFRFMLTLFIALLTIYILYSGKEGNLAEPGLLFMLLGGFLAMMGNYFQALRPNYFIGIRTPWTLEDEEVWRKTHRLGGRMWMAGGVLIIILSMLISNHTLLISLFAAIVAVIVLAPVVFSFIEFRKQKKSLN